MNIQLERMLKGLCGAEPEYESILDGTVMTREEAEKVLEKWGTSLRELQPIGVSSLDEFLDDPHNYEVGLRNLNVDLHGGNRVLFAEVAVQYTRLPYKPRLNVLGGILRKLDLLPPIPQTTRDLPMYFPSIAIIDKPDSELEPASKGYSTA